MNYTGSFSLNSLGLGQSGLMQAYQTGMTAQSDATAYKPFAYNPDSGKVRRPRQGDPAVDSFQRYLEASMANNLPSYPLSNPFNHAAHYRNIVYTAVSSMMRVLSGASIRLEIKRDGSGGMASVAGDSRDHDYVPFNDHYLSDFLRSPNPADDFASFLGKCILQYHLTGRLLIWGVPNKWGLPVRFYVLPTALCIPNPGVPTDRYPMGAWRVQNYYPSSGMVGILPGPAAGIASTPGALIDAREIYVMNNPHPLFNWASLSGLDAMGVQTDVVEMLDRAFWSVYRQGPRIAGILTAPGATADQIDDLNSAINSTYAGPDNAGKIWTTGGRVDAPSFTPISLGPEQLDITARATYEAQIIAAVTGQDRTVLGLKTDGVGSYSERWAAMADVRERTYIPWLGMLASMLTRGPVRDWGLEDKGVRVAIRLPRLNDPVMVQADTNAGAADGTMTTDEVRARRDMGPDPLGLGHLPPAIRTMTLQLAAEQGGLPPNPTPPGDDGSEETVDIADPSDDGTALGALRASREEPDGEPIAPTAAVEAAKAQQGKPRSGQPRKPAGAGTKSKAGKSPPKKGKPEKKSAEDSLHAWMSPKGDIHPVGLLTHHEWMNKHLGNPGGDVIHDGFSRGWSRMVYSGNDLILHNGAKHPTRTQINSAKDAAIVRHMDRLYVDTGEDYHLVWSNDDTGTDVKALPENPEHRTEAVHGLHLALLDDPLNHGLRQIYADALDDAGAYHEAAVHRMIADIGRHAPGDHHLGFGNYDPELAHAATHIAGEAGDEVVRRMEEHSLPGIGFQISGHTDARSRALPRRAYVSSNTARNMAADGAAHDGREQSLIVHHRDAETAHSTISVTHGRAADNAEAAAEARGLDSRTFRISPYHRLAQIAHGVASRAHGHMRYVVSRSELKSDLAQSAFTDSLGGTLVPAAGSATVPAKKKRRVLSSRESHSVIERAVAEVLGVVTPAVEAKAAPVLCSYGTCTASATKKVRMVNALRQPTSESAVYCDYHAVSVGTNCPRGDYIESNLPEREDNSRSLAADVEHQGRRAPGNVVKAELADPDPTPAFDRYAAHRKHLATLPVVGSSPLGNPVNHSNVSHVLTLQHPRRQIKAVFKPSEGEQPGLRMYIPMHAGAQAARESAASHVAEIAGFHDLVPATTLRHHDGQHGSVQRFVGDGILAAKLAHEERFGNNHDDVRRAAAFDYLIGNTDRHLGNWLVRPTPHGDKITLIDHGLAFPERHPDGRESYNFEMLRSAMYHKPTRGDVAPNPGGSDPDGKWLAIRRTLTEHGLSSKAIADTGKRWRVLTSGRFHFGDLLTEHPDDLLAKLKTAPATTPTRSGV